MSPQIIADARSRLYWVPGGDLPAVEMGTVVAEQIDEPIGYTGLSPIATKGVRLTFRRPANAADGRLLDLLAAAYRRAVEQRRQRLKRMHAAYGRKRRGWKA